MDSSDLASNVRILLSTCQLVVQVLEHAFGGIDAYNSLDFGRNLERAKAWRRERFV